MSDVVALGARIAELRQEKGLSRQRVAELSNVDRSAIAAWEQGKYQPRPERLATIAAALGISRAELLGKRQQARPGKRVKSLASAVDTIDELPSVLVELTRKCRLVRAFRLAAPYPTAAYVQTEWRKLVAQRICSGAMEVQRVEIIYGLPRLKEILSNIFRYDGCKYFVKCFCHGVHGVAPAMGGYMFDNDEFLLGAYWTGTPPNNKPGLHLAGEPFAGFFAAYWSEIWSRGTPINMRGKHDLSEVRQMALGLGLEPSQWPAFVKEAQVLEIGDGAPPLV